MFNKILSATTAILATASLVAAQTSSLCDPTKKACSADKAFPASFQIDFTKGESDAFNIAAGTSLSYDGANGAVFSMKTENDAPTVTSKNYLFFGRVDVVARAAPGAGIVSSFVLESDDLDEIDWEWVGNDALQGQTNYFSKGDDSTYDRGGFSPVSDPQGTFHKYSIDWTPTVLTWLIDDTPVRTLTYANAKNGATYPQTPMQIKLGAWVAGKKGISEGTISWAGGMADFSKGPFTAYYKSVTITNNSNGKSGATEYVYGDQSGTMGSIVIKTDGSKDTDSSTTTTVASGTTTKTTSSSTSSATTLTTVTSSSSSSSSSTAPATTSGVSTSSQAGSSSSTTTSASSTSARATSTTVSQSAAGKVALTPSNVAIMAAAIFLGSLAL